MPHFSTLWKYSAREVRRRPGRSILTLLGIVFGVAAIVAITITTSTTHTAFRSMFEAVAGRAALEVVPSGQGGFDAHVLAAVRAVDGVQAAVPVVQTPAVLLGARGGAGVLVLGIDPRADQQVRTYELREGRLLDDTDGLLLEAGFAQAQGVSLGQRVRLMTPAAESGGILAAPLPVVGLLELDGAATFNGGAVAFMPLATAQRSFGFHERINSIQIVLAEGADAATVQALLQPNLPAGLSVQAPASRGGLAQDSLLSTELGLGSLSVVSLVAGAFVILNAFLMNLGERRRQFAILRALGATRRQVTRLLLREAAFFAALGLALGLGISVLQRGIMGPLLGVTLPRPRLTLTPFFLAALLGPGMALAATYYPARRAGRRAPLEDLLQKGPARQERPRRWPSYAGLALLSLVFVTVLGILEGWFPLAVVPSLLAPAVGCGLAGCVLALPLIMRPLARLAGWLVRPALGMEGRLALRQLERHPTRTALTAGVLFIGVAVSIAFGQSLLNSVRDIERWCDENLRLDFIVRGVMADTSLVVTPAPLPETLAEELARLDGVAFVGKVNFIPARVHGRQVIVLPVSVDSGRDMPFSLVAGHEAEVKRRFLQGEVVVATALAHRVGLQVGDEITVATRLGPRGLRIAALTSEYTVGGMVLYMNWDQGKELFVTRGVHALTVKARPGTAPGLDGTLRRFCGDRGLFCQSFADFRGLLERMISGVVNLYWGLVGLVFVVASLGVVNTLTMNVLEQTRELGILRAIALKRRQVRKMILAQALALSVMSLLPGMLAGVLLAYLMNLGVHPVLGQWIAFHLDVPFLAGCFVTALAIAVLAAWFPARRAARLQVVQALHYE